MRAKHPLPPQCPLPIQLSYYLLKKFAKKIIKKYQAQKLFYFAPLCTLYYDYVYHDVCEVCDVVMFVSFVMSGNVTELKWLNRLAEGW